jgi:hypothetical protein
MSAHKEMTRHAFISHMEDYMKKLLTDPLHADTDEFLKYHKIDGPKALSILTKKIDPNDKNSAVVIKTTKIKNNGIDDNGKRKPDSFTVQYKALRKDYLKKMRNLYINLFESNIIEDSPLNEGAWGYGILDNDSACDNQSKFGISSLILLKTRLNSSKTDDEKWANLGVLVDFLKRYDDAEFIISDEYNSAIELCKTTTKEFLNNKTFIESWNNPNKMKSELKKIFDKVSAMAYDKNRLNEDGEGAGAACTDGATNASCSGQYTTKILGDSPIRRKTMYITQEQQDYLKKMIDEEAVMGTMFGDFGYDAPAFGKKKDPSYDHKNMMKKSWTDGKNDK